MGECYPSILSQRERRIYATNAAVQRKAGSRVFAGWVCPQSRGKRRAALVGILVGNGLFLGDRENGEGRAVVPVAAW